MRGYLNSQNQGGSESLHVLVLKQQRLLNKVVGPGDREVKRLGKGGERLSDLVVNRHGLEVRKVPLLKQDSRRHIKSMEVNATRRGGV